MTLEAHKDKFDLLDKLTLLEQTYSNRKKSDSGRSVYLLLCLLPFFKNFFSGLFSSKGKICLRMF